MIYVLTKITRIEQYYFSYYIIAIVLIISLVFFLSIRIHYEWRRKEITEEKEYDLSKLLTKLYELAYDSIDNKFLLILYNQTINRA